MLNEIKQVHKIEYCMVSFVEETQNIKTKTELSQTGRRSRWRKVGEGKGVKKN